MCLGGVVCVCVCDRARERERACVVSGQIIGVCKSW